MHLPDPFIQPDFYKDVPVKRVLAWGIDVVITAIGCLLILPFTFFTGIFFLPFLFLIVGFAYRTVTIANSSGTWGMRVFAIELRRANGSPMDLQAAAAHTLGYTLSWAVPVFQLISIIMMGATKRGQGLSDHVMGTVMINRKSNVS